MCKPEGYLPSCIGNGQQEGAQVSLFLGTVQRAAHQMANIVRELEVSQPTTTSIANPPLPAASDPVEVVIHLKAGTHEPEKKDQDTAGTHEPEKKDQDKKPSVGHRAKKSKRRIPRSADKKQSDDNHEQDTKRSRVEHRYHDYANALPEDLPDAEVEKKSRGGISSPFPVILHSMLERADTHGYSGIVSWQPHGRAFHVHDQDRFVAEIMPLYTRMSRFSSFQRQLSLYGFLRLTRKGPDHGAYYHELFLRGKPILCHKMQRTRVKGYWVRQSSSPETEPDFTCMLPVGPSSEVANMWVGSNVAMLPLPTTTTTTTTGGPSATSAFPSLAQGSLWDLMQLSPASLSVNNKHGGGVPGFDGINSFMTSAGKMKLPPMPPLAGSYMVDLNYGAPLLVDNNNDKNINVTAPPFRPLKLPPMLPLKTAPAPLETEFPRAPPASPASGAEMGHEHTIAEIANEFSAAERQDIAAFLSDVDLDSEDEKEVAYKNEEELGRILHAKKKSSKKVSSV